MRDNHAVEKKKSNRWPRLEHGQPPQVYEKTAEEELFLELSFVRRSRKPEQQRVDGLATMTELRCDGACMEPRLSYVVTGPVWNHV
ncbi:hypothetical protein RRG08_058741 [Elysia crispata]|uniref:Uncharacterized protein n=1 Tax=Elysia crispata TaxID=231223 RepID=A0AAE0YXR2_9GAST|nr:hypothetical protein RRG08_058741 [Elysia crispata]